MTVKASEKKMTPNFVVIDPTGALDDKKVNLSLTNFPASGVLKYVLSQAGATATWNQHGITIHPTASGEKE